MSILLDVKNLGISFGGLRAVNKFDLTIQKEQLYGLIGPNGAGKTTVFNLLTGVYKPDAGKVILDGKDITGERNIEISKAGIARTFQNIRLFKQLSVLDNVKAGLHNHHPYSTLSGILRLPSYRKVEKEMDDRAMELLKVFDLEKYADHQAANLPYGQQRKLEIARLSISLLITQIRLPITRISNPVVLALIAKVNFLMINNYLMSNSLIRFPSRIVPLRNFNLSKRCR